MNKTLLAFQKCNKIWVSKWQLSFYIIYLPVNNRNIGFIFQWIYHNKSFWFLSVFRWIAFLQILIYRCMELFIIMPLDIHFVAYTVGIKLLKLYNHQLIWQRYKRKWLKSSEASRMLKWKLSFQHCFSL